MKNIFNLNIIFSHLLTCLWIAVATMLVCCAAYPLVILGFAQLITPNTANGSLIKDGRGDIIGSRLIAQDFSRPGYFWPRPSAVNYDADASGGSNLSPSNPKLRSRAEVFITRLGIADEMKIPADLVTASGSGLDPQITLIAAEYQAQRVAAARGLPVATVTKILHKFAKRPGGAFTPEPLVNVLLINIILDKGID